MRTPREFSALADALRRLADRGEVAQFWLRDDDAIAPTPALDRLLGLTQRFAVPVALAVIPAGAVPALSRRLADAPLATPLVHGWAHVNHAPAGEKKQEFGCHRPSEVAIAELSHALQRMTSLFGGHLAPVLVPPWNRVDFGLLQHLPSIGYGAVSVFGKALSEASLPMINTHVDPMDWRGAGGSRDHVVLAEEFASLLMATAKDRAIGILTHHLVHDAGAWQFLEKLFELTTASNGCRWLSITQLLREHNGVSE